MSDLKRSPDTEIACCSTSTHRSKKARVVNVAPKVHARISRMHEYIKQRNYVKVQELLDSGDGMCQLRTKSKTWTCFQWAIQYPEWNILKCFLDLDPTLVKNPKYGPKLLRVSIKNFYKVKYLIENGLDLQVCAIQFHILLDALMEGCDNEAFRLLLERAPDYFCIKEESGNRIISIVLERFTIIEAAEIINTMCNKFEIIPSHSINIRNWNLNALYCDDDCHIKGDVCCCSLEAIDVIHQSVLEFEKCLTEHDEREMYIGACETILRNLAKHFYYPDYMEKKNNVLIKLIKIFASNSAAFPLLFQFLECTFEDRSAKYNRKFARYPCSVILNYISIFNEHHLHDIMSIMTEDHKKFHLQVTSDVLGVIKNYNESDGKVNALLKFCFLTSRPSEFLKVYRLYIKTRRIQECSLLNFMACNLSHRITDKNADNYSIVFDVCMDNGLLQGTNVSHFLGKLVNAYFKEHCVFSIFLKVLKNLDKHKFNIKPHIYYHPQRLVIKYMDCFKSLDHLYGILKFIMASSYKETCMVFEEEMKFNHVCVATYELNIYGMLMKKVEDLPSLLCCLSLLYENHVPVHDKFSVSTCTILLWRCVEMIKKDAAFRSIAKQLIISTFPRLMQGGGHISQRTFIYEKASLNDLANQHQLPDFMWIAISEECLLDSLPDIIKFYGPHPLGMMIFAPPYDDVQSTEMTNLTKSFSKLFVIFSKLAGFMSHGTDTYSAFIYHTDQWLKHYVQECQLTRPPKLIRKVLAVKSKPLSLRDLSRNAVRQACEMDKNIPANVPSFELPETLRAFVNLECL